MNKFGLRLFGLVIAGFGGFLSFSSVKDVVVAHMDIFPVNFIMCLLGTVFLFCGIALLIGKGVAEKQEQKSPSKGMSKRSIISLIIAIALTGIFWFGISGHEDQCRTDFGTHSSGANRPRYGSCVCDTGYWLSATTHTCVPAHAICQENNIPAVSASVELKPNYDDYVQCKMTDNTTKEIDRNSAYPYYFK